MTIPKSTSSVPLQRGIKFDADKARLGEMFLDFSIPLEYVARVWEFGAHKYGKSNWKYVENARNRYTNALLRHLAKETENEFDDETKLLHAAHVAWNALARLFFIANLQDKDAYKEFLKEVKNNPAPGVPANDLEGRDILDALDKAREDEMEYKQLKLELFDTTNHPKDNEYHSDYNFET